MKIDRRSFLSFIIGGAAGTALSPLPWKLTDDLSIWTQNWPWTPVPALGAVSTVASTCTLCPAGCGISVRKVEERVVKIEGMADHPINNGGICALGLSGVQLLYGPSRVQNPLKRVGERGAGQWTQVSWEQALADIADTLKTLRAKHQPHSLAAMIGPGRGTVPRLFDRFFTAYGSPNIIQTASIRDVNEMAAMRLMDAAGPVGYDIDNTDFLLSFGAGILEGWDSPVRMFKANSDRLDNGGKLFQVEHRLSNTATKASQWIAVKPGAEAVLALGIAHVMIQESLYDPAFVDAHTEGFDRFSERLAREFTPDAVAEKTGVDKSTIVALAKAFARARNPLAVCGRGQGGATQSIAEVMAIQALNALAGRINRPGGLWTVSEPDYITWDEPVMDQAATRGMEMPRIDGAGSDAFPDARHLAGRLAGVINSGKDYPIQALMISDANPCYTMPDTAAFKKALAAVPFIVSFSSYMDETARMADYILPNHTYLERYEDIPAPAGYPKPFVGMVKPVVSPQYDTMHVGDVLLALARELGGSIAESFPWESYDACIEETLDDRWEQLVESGFWVDSAYRPAAPERFVFPDTALPAEAFALEGDPAAYPLILVPYDSMRLAHGAVGNTPFMTKTVADTVLKGNDGFVEVNPATAGKIGLSEGRPAVLKTPKGSARVRVHLSERLGPGLVALPRGLGHSAYDTYLTGKGVNYNDLAGPMEDTASGFDASWGIRAQLSRA